MKPLRLAVVGHTNTGKTSLLRTLTRDPEFGEVADSPSTTRHVEAAALLLEGKAVIELFDTPGLEDAVALHEYIDSLAPPSERLDGPARIERFLQTREATLRFEQEAKVLRQLAASDAGLYVVDARDPVLEKHRDELALLASCARPLLPVLNFVSAAGHRVPEWRDALARLGLHAIVEFDTVAPAVDGEQRLYEKLGTLLDSAAPMLTALIADHARHRILRREAAGRIVADMLIDCAALRVPSPPEAQAVALHEEALRNLVRQREQRCMLELLALYGFRQSDLAGADLPAWNARLEHDLFNPEALKDMGIEVGKGVAAGAAAGAALDLATGGLSLGTGTLVGAAVGGLWQTAGRFGERFMGRLKGARELTVDDAVLRLLALRQRWLIGALEARGHAAQQPLALDTAQDEELRKGTLPTELRDARGHPEWSSMAKSHQDTPRRRAAVVALAQALG
ncbi:DUF3482 domain-containing protein [Verticiella sediminum]|uniref:DUF3482 domain-containing protein n=1 Tax=Verticiella sediminum TaxID=1247510 RepID=A0A556ATY8_9BURK|nr:GTPase/DUF3482 domain-containing protein [Verticiella sediminum]TSH96408.1 DUF3482 domain-containing protein [Verticiella sediminum]